jgi:hypothetical protein
VTYAEIKVFTRRSRGTPEVRVSGVVAVFTRFKCPFIFAVCFNCNSGSMLI